ncbi:MULTISPECIES: GerAB/ArcD/ProY family transporter [Pontibacillus]|uniref:GerAB/ArcD/ProY family transporter n=1 Tax=Pontibacillus chungwhensis TaxID=265426 RepID=A0ABY8UU69_9BACI|nr:MULTISPECIES: GerAB/ArcD/ProY family transporter [Pontibacillus]MCD5323487.1 spore germination protein [Pontibacillus sp. HN14]WIF96863.1 GerAB/ArcD/ProY family transporter [Pontibacillus chungwhensis]
MKSVLNTAGLSQNQVTVGICLTVLGVGMITLPREVFTAAGIASGWVSVLITGALAIGVTFLLVTLNNRYPGATYFEYNRLIVGTWAGGIITFLTTIYYLAFAAFEARAMAELIQMFILDRTPVSFTILIFIGTAVYLVLGGLSAVFRLFELYFPAIIFFTLLIMILSANQFEVNHLRPFFEGFTPIVKGLSASILSFVGIEIILYVQAHMKNPNQVKKAVVYGIAIPTFMYTLIVIMVGGIMGVGETKTLVYPLMELAKSIEIRNFFFERFETFFIPLWILSIFTTMSVVVYLAALGMKKVFHIKRETAVFTVIPIIYILAMTPKDINEMFTMGIWIGYSMILFGIVIPLLLLLISLIRRQRQ